MTLTGGFDAKTGEVIVSGSLSDLFRLRQKYDALVSSTYSLKRVGLANVAGVIDAYVQHYAGIMMAVDVPCILCRRTSPVSIWIGDPARPTPRHVVCDDCDLKTGGRRGP
jgi:hypothetical protein